MRKTPLIPFVVAALAVVTFFACASWTNPSRGSRGANGDITAEDDVATRVPDDVDLTLEEVSQNPPSDDELADSEADTATETEEEDDVDVAEETAPEELGEGFCNDDIYARYLTSKYLADNPLKYKPTKPTRSRRARSRESLREVEAMHFAAGRLAGPMSPYFGALPVVANPRVEFWLRYFKNSGRRDFLRWMVRGQSLKELVPGLLQKEGLPKELLYLAMIESGFNNSALSSARATGTWQFMQGTAKLYGLKVNWWTDERRDPVKSTIAAARLLRDLYEDFGDWYLAMAAYNAGPGKVRSAIRRSGSRDFWTIAQTDHLRQETKDYVPKMLAALILSSSAQTHGFDVQADAGDELPMTSVTVREPVLIAEVASRMGLCESDIRRWNPELVRNVVPPTRDGYALRLPPQYVDAFAAVEPTLSVLEISDILMHRIRPGDTLSRIARAYKVSIKQILQYNSGIQAGRLRLGRDIAVPVPSVRPRPRVKEVSDSSASDSLALLRAAGATRQCREARVSYPVAISSSDEIGLDGDRPMKRVKYAKISKPSPKTKYTKSTRAKSSINGKRAASNTQKTKSNAPRRATRRS